MPNTSDTDAAAKANSAWKNNNSGEQHRNKLEYLRECQKIILCKQVPVLETESLKD